MKLQPALIFGEHMLLQRHEPIPVWGRSVRNDTVTVTLGGNTASARTVGGRWQVELPPMEATERTSMKIESALTGEKLLFDDVAVGEVWLAGGQSNMEFLMKYDECAEEMFETPADANLRYFRYPLTNFLGCLEKEPFPDDGFWRSWDDQENRGMFSAAAAVMGLRLREKLGVPVGFIGCHWGGTPASAWTSREALKANPALKPLLDWFEERCLNIDYKRYFAASELPEQEPSPEEQARRHKFMMGEGLEELFKSMPAFPMMETDYMPGMPGPRACTRPAGLYENMLTRVAPYPVRGVIWYQGEHDDLWERQSVYGESMITMIQSWRKLWQKELPFLQVELAPYEGIGRVGAKDYPLMRSQQRLAADTLPGVHDVCIMDAGDRINIHVRKKKPVGERLALLARKYVYGETQLLADSPRYKTISHEGDRVCITFDDAGEGLSLRGPIGSVLKVTADGAEVSPGVQVSGDTLILISEAFVNAGKLRVDFAQLNYCEDPLFSSAGLPAFPFTAQIEG